MMDLVVSGLQRKRPKGDTFDYITSILEQHWTDLQNPLLTMASWGGERAICAIKVWGRMLTAFRRCTVAGTMRGKSLFLMASDQPLHKDLVGSLPDIEAGLAEAI